MSTLPEGWAGLHRANAHTLQKLREQIDNVRSRLYSPFDAGLAEMREEQIKEARQSLKFWQDRLVERGTYAEQVARREAERRAKVKS